MKSTQDDTTPCSQKGKPLNLTERKQIERWLKEKVSASEIAHRLGRHKSSIYREIKRGTTKRTNSDLSVSYVYRWDVAQRLYEKNKGGGGRHPKLHAAHPLLASLAQLITKNSLSPYSAMRVLEKDGHQLDFCEKTLYNHIDKPNFPINREQLPYGRRYRKRKRDALQSPRKHKNLKGESIEKRPDIINAREEAGHHEMDLVVGARGSKKALLVITERVTRYQHIILIKDKTQRSVIKALNRLERRWGKEGFATLFKSITCDNGIEFQNFTGIEQSVFSKKKKRTKVYFAHPYSSFERGSNENANRLIRRILPKGCTFDSLKQSDVQRLARWMNKMPRKIFDGKSASEMAKACGLNFRSLKR